MRISLASIIAADIDGLSTFYADVFGLPEVTDLRSDIFVGLDIGGTTLGFSTPVVYDMLGLQAWSPATGAKQYLTFEADSDDHVNELTDVAVAKGADLLHAPHETYYGAWQSVLADPEGNPFRINHFR